MVPSTDDDFVSTLAGEQRNGTEAWANNPYGLLSPLSTKRKQRGWAELAEGLNDGDGDDDDVKALILWNGGESGREMFRGRLPWNRDGDLPT